MKLKSLYIQEYKNIKEQTFDFSNNTGYIALIGLNSSGKSNLIEAIALIFNSLLNKKKIPFKYEIQYEYDGKIYTRKPQLAYIDGKKVKNSEMFYPSSVIACYSGEELRLWHMAFEDYHMHYFKNAIEGNLSTPNFIYLNKYCWSIALIALMSSENDEIKKFLKENLNIDDLNEVEISIEFAEVENFKDHAALKWINRIKEECLDKQGKATLKSFLSYDVTLPPNQTKEKEKGRTIFHYLYLLSQPKKNTEKGNTIDKYITRIRVFNKGISLLNFSEGHKKLILIECITRILGDNSSLLLLDEPDAYVHIALKKEILNSIENFQGQSILTTHSPILANEIQKTNGNNLFFMKDGCIIDSEIIKKLIDLSGGEMDFISGTVVVGSRKILVVEGISDVRCLQKAVEVFAKRDKKYEQLLGINYISSGGTGDVKEIFTEVLVKQINSIEKVVYLFDIDDAGKKGFKKIEELKQDAKYKDYALKIEAIHYKDDTSKNFELEDLFPKKAYDCVIKDLHTLESYRDFKTRKNSTSNQIKEHIKNNASTFEDCFYNDFQNILDKLLDIFDFNKN
ncbi:MAG: AAA family ATPase [Prevotella sp.]|nr:AAA family ATPase [Prevotella sp.]